MLRTANLVLAFVLFTPSAVRAETLAGSSAFGSWSEDRPGTIRHITLGDLPAAEPDKAAANPPKLIPMSADARPELPRGFVADLVASGINNPRVLRFAPNGDLFIADSKQNQILVYRLEGSKVLQNTTFASNGWVSKPLSQPYGIAFYPPGPDPQWIYVANSNGVVRYPYKSGDLTASAAPEEVISNIPSNHHWTRDIAFSPDGKTLYLTVGSGSNIAEDMAASPAGTGVEEWAKAHALGAAWGSEEGRANVLTFTPDGQDRAVFAAGLRNCAGMTIQPSTGQPWCVVNERDGLGDNLPFEFATALKQGAFYGWPWYYTGDHRDGRVTSERPDLQSQVTVGDVLMQAHSAPLGIAFYQGSAFPSDYAGDAFVTLHGSWNRAQRTGYKVVRLHFKDGKPTGEYEDFMIGFVKNDDEIWGRPVGVAVAPDGSLFISEDGNGTIWRISYHSDSTAN